MAYDLRTRNNHNMYTMASLLQKAIRRGDNVRAGYAAMELFGAYNTMLWNRVMTVASEDCWGILEKEIVALRYADQVWNAGKKGYERDTKFVSKAITLLCGAKKSRDACYYACNFVLQTEVTDPGELKTGFISQTKREIDLVNDEAFSIDEIRGPVGKWEVPTEEERQLSVFDMIQTEKPESQRITDAKNIEDKILIWESFLRKGIRTLDMELAGYAIHHLRQHDFPAIWKTLYVISRNECRGIPTREIVALKHCDSYVNNKKVLEKRDEIYICKGIMILMYQISGRYDSLVGNGIMDAEELIDWDNHPYIEIRDCKLPNDIIPEWVFDVHTIKGKRAGKTDWDMNLVEHAALTPLQSAFFDEASWQPRYDYKYRNGLCTEREYRAMLEYSKTRKGNPVARIEDKFS